MLAQNICLNCNRNPCENSYCLCETCENEHEGWTEMDKTETHNKRDKKGNKFQRKCIVKIRKLKNDYRTLKIMQRDIEKLKKSVIRLQINMEKVQDEVECLQQNQHNEKIKRVTDKSKPLSASTPVSRPSGRPQCRDTYRDVASQYSPIYRNYSNNMSSHANSTSNAKDESNSESDRDLSSTDDNIEEHSNRQLKKFSTHLGTSIKDRIPESAIPSVLGSKKFSNHLGTSIKDRIPESANPSVLGSTFLYILALMAVTLAVSYQMFFGYCADPMVSLSIIDLKNNFPHQRPDTWIAIESGIHDVEIMNKPSVFLFIYNDQTEHFLKKFINNVSVFASCVLNSNCSVNPVELKGDKLHDLQIQDYGILIDKYHSQIEQRKVMIIYNLEEIPGELAQAFHTMCDEYNPLVSKSVYFFTMKIEKDEGSTIPDIERILRHKWYTLNDDLFDPLFTRISSMIIVIQPEDN